jgi:hypothetical protein
LQAWILEQQMFFVATAPLAADGHVNVSPKGLSGTFTVLDPRRCAYLDFTGSGAETIAHLRENGRIVLMFCAFAGAPQIVRLHGRGAVHLPTSARFEQLRAGFDNPRSARARAVIEVSVQRISDSCGFGVPLMSYAGQRDLLEQWNDRKSAEDIADYQATRNATSIDGLPALTPKPAEAAVSSSP